MAEKKEYYGASPVAAYLAAQRYQKLFNFFAREHNLILTVSQMDDIIDAVEKHKMEKGSQPES